MKRCNKGEFGYISYRKKKIVILSLVIVLVAAAIFGAGLLMNNMSKTNIFTVIAIMAVLPWAKQMVALVVFFPYHSVAKERYEKVSERVPRSMKLYTDLVITSPDKVMNLDFAAVGCGQVIVLVGKKGQDVAYIRSYLSEGVAQWGKYKVRVLEPEKEKLFLSELEHISEKDAEEDETENVNAYLRSLIV